MEELKEQQAQPKPSIIDQIKEYVETRVKLAKYQAVDTGTSIIATVVTLIAIIIFVLMLLVFASFTLAFFLADVLGSVWQGFGCVALLYLIILLVLNAKKQSVEKTIANKLIDNFLN
jgi:hypothetical protein